MRLAAIADLHGNLPDIPPCDVLLIGGDLCPAADHDVEVQADWLDGPFRAWLERLPAEEIVAIAGNHDFVFERAPGLLPADLPWVYLQDHDETLGCGLKVWGSPWTPWFFDWAFNAPREDGEAFLAARYASVPDDVDVLLLHGPPRGYGDRTVRGMEVGSTAELALIDRVRPRACVFGHIHEGRGAWMRDETQLVNASAVTVEYELRDTPVVLLDV
ncbi:MAG: metallophosphoesterase [Solirubrobacteraceae bacterium]|nr:metallophosphoesterase [Solirubrobacteraceae bacterium]